MNTQHAAQMPSRTLDDWRQLCAGYLIAAPELLDKAAAIAYEHDVAGKPCGVWHASAIASGRLDRCNCRPCELARQVQA